MIHSTRTGAPARWSPDVLEEAPPETDPVHLKAILDIFRLAAEAGETGEPARSQARVEAWNPLDLSELPGFDEEPEPFLDEPDEADAAGYCGKAPAHEATVEEEARAALERAQAQAAEILLHAQRSADELIEEARQEIAAARDAAYRQGIETAQNEARSYLTAAQAMMGEIDTWKAQLFEQSSPLLIDMVKEIAQKMFGQGIALDDQALQQNLNRVMSSAKSLGDLNIYLHPLDAATLNSAWREMCASITGSQIRIYPAESITRGGCYVQGQWGAIDAQVETQIQSVMESFDNIRADAGNQ